MRIKVVIFALLTITLVFNAVMQAGSNDIEPVIHVEAEPIPAAHRNPIPKPDPISTPQPTMQNPTTKVKAIQPPDLNIPLDEELKNYIYEQCGYDDDLYCFMVAVIQKESSFIEDAVSADGHDHGLMQLRDSYYDAWIEEYNVSNPKESYDNVTVGIALLKEYLEKYEYKNLALMCYNCGESGAKKLWKKDIYSTKYTVNVLSNYESYLAEAKEGETP